VKQDWQTRQRADERRHDERRKLSLEGRGWTILRFWNSEV
jgi:very-short-patch-repair endonuclease